MMFAVRRVVICMRSLIETPIMVVITMINMAVMKATPRCLAGKAGNVLFNLTIFQAKQSNHRTKIPTVDRGFNSDG